VGGGRAAGHVEADLAEDHVGSGRVHTGDRVEELDGGAVWLVDSPILSSTSRTAPAGRR
jgi:hypothetical protein